MKIYDSFGPNPRALRMFLAEKDVDFPKVDGRLDGRREPAGAVHRQEPRAVSSRRSSSTTAACIGETVAIFEYLEEKYPNPPLIGRTAEERAEARMWQRRVELKITEHLYNGFRFAEGVDLFRSRMRVLPEAAEGLKATARDNLAWLDKLLARQAVHRRRPLHGRRHHPLLRRRLRRERQPTADNALTNVAAWKQRVASRPSAAASLHPHERRHRHERVRTRVVNFSSLRESSSKLRP